MIEWKQVDPKNPPQCKPGGPYHFLFWFDGAAYTGSPLCDLDERDDDYFWDERDDDGYPAWEPDDIRMGNVFYDIRWYAELNKPPKE